MNRGAEFKVGITVLTAVLVMIFGVIWLKEISLHDQKRVYLVAFPTTGGLAASDEVQVNGVRKGQVNGMRLAGDRVVVDLELATDVPLTRDSRVSIRDVGMMGEKVIGIELHPTGGTYAKGDTVIGFYEPGMSEVMGHVGETVDAITELATELRDMTRSINRDGQLAATVKDFAATSRELREMVVENRVQLTQTMKNFSDASATARSLTTDREAELRKALDHFSAAAENMDRLSGRLDSLRVTVQTLANHVNNGDGTIGKLVNDQRLYDELNSSVVSLKSLIEDIKKNPKRYFKVSVF